MDIQTNQDNNSIWGGKREYWLRVGKEGFSRISNVLFLDLCGGFMSVLLSWVY